MGAFLQCNAFTSSVMCVSVAIQFTSHVLPPSVASSNLAWGANPFFLFPSCGSSGTYFVRRRDDDLRSQQYSERQAMGYQKKRHEGSQDEITSA